MLTITDGQMRAYRSESLHRIDPRIDAWLVSTIPEWAQVPAEQRRRALHDMVDRADAAGMTAETDFALYCDLMVRVGPGWHGFVASEDAREVVEDPDSSPATKLDELTELAKLHARANAQ